MSLIQAVLNEFMPCGGSACRGCEVECAHGGHTNGGRTPDVDSMADALIKAREQRDALRTQLAAARELMAEAATDIEYMVNAEYHGPDDVHPAMRAKYTRDMEIVSRLTAALTQGDA